MEESVSTNSNQPLPITSTKNFATWTNEFIDCWDTTGRFSLKIPGCLKHFALEYVLGTGVNLVGAKNLIKDSTVQANITQGFSILNVLNGRSSNLNLTSGQPQGNDVAADGLASSAFGLKPAMFIIVLVAAYIF